MADFRLTYSTMFNPPEELHNGFDKAVTKLKGNLGKEYGMIIDGKDVFADDKFEDRSPVNTDWVLAVLQKGNATHANMAIEAARKAFPGWSRIPWPKRVQLVRKAASNIEKRIFELGAAMALEVGKNRLESLGDVQETADLMYYSAQMMEENDGFIKPMGKDPLVGYDSTNVSVLRPYGVWLVISPFNFPFALTGSNAQTVTVGSLSFLGGATPRYNLTAAAALIALIPPLILALSIQRFLVRGLTFGAVKG